MVFQLITGIDSYLREGLIWSSRVDMANPLLERDPQLEQKRLDHFKRRKLIRITTISVVALAIVLLGLYHFTDLIFGPPEGLNSNSIIGEWAMFRHDLERSGSTGPSTVLPKGKLSAVFSTDGGIHSSPTVANGNVYFGSRDGKLYALDAATGTKLWEFKTGSWVESSPAFANGILYFGSNDGRLYALDASTGEKLWDFKTKYAVRSSPAVADGVVYFGSDEYCMYALDAIGGTELWHFEPDGPVVSSPAVSGGIIYVGSMDRCCYALHALNGRLRLKFQSYSPIISSPAVADGGVYSSSSKGLLYAFDADARNWPRENELIRYWKTMYVYGVAPEPPTPSGFQWFLRLEKTTSSSPVVMDGILYIGSGNKLFSIDMAKHERRWVFETEGIISSSPAAAGTTVYIGSQDGHLYALDAVTGGRLWDIPTGGKITSSPAVANGKVYIGSHDGNLYIIE